MGRAYCFCLGSPVLKFCYLGMAKAGVEAIPRRHERGLQEYFLPPVVDGQSQ